MKLRYLPVFLFPVMSQVANSRVPDGIADPGKAVYTMNCTFVDAAGKAVGESQKYTMRKMGDHEQMEITPQKNAHVPPPIYIQKTHGAYTDGGKSFKDFYWNGASRMTVIRGDKATVEIEFIDSPAMSIMRSTCDQPVYLP